MLVLEAMRSIVDRSSFEQFEFVVVVDTATPSNVVDAIEQFDSPTTIVPFDAEFNFSAKVNAGAARARGDLLLFLNDDTELIEPDSIGEMAALLDQDDVAMVGAKLLYSDGTLQHAGHVFPGFASHALLGYAGDQPGPYRMAAVERECSGVTAAAAMVRADLFAELGGFDAGAAAQLQRRRPVVSDAGRRLPHRVDTARRLVPLRERDTRSGHR